MVSIQILDSEKESLFEEGVRGENAKKLGKTGDGIGLNRVSRILKLNNAKLSIRNNTDKQYYKTVQGIRYEKNIFAIEFENTSTTGFVLHSLHN